MFPNIENKVICIDLETTGLNPRKDDIFGVAFCEDGGTPMYWDVRRTPKVMDWLKDQLMNVKLFVNHTTKFDAKFLHRAGIPVPFNKLRCVAMRAALIDENLLHYSLDALASKYLNERKVNDIYEELSAIFGGEPKRSVQARNFHKAPFELMERYAKKDAELALKLFHRQDRIIAQQSAEDRMNRLGRTLRDCVDLEEKLLGHICQMEIRGIRVDTTMAKLARDKVLTQLSSAKAGFMFYYKGEFNYNPGTKCIKDLFNAKYYKNGLWRCVDGTFITSTKQGGPSFSRPNLERMRHPAAALILKCRQLDKTANTFLRNHVLGHAEDGYVYPNINQTKTEDDNFVGFGGVEGTRTGRMSMSHPAMQQIPARNKAVAKIVRPIFRPHRGQLWAYGDLDQHEIRVYVHYVRDRAAVAAYQANPDMDAHQWVADLTGLPRKASKSGEANAKQLNIAVVFGMGRGTAAAFMGLPHTIESYVDRYGNTKVRTIAGEEANRILDQFHREMPGVNEMYDKAQNVAKKRGYISTLSGRRIRFPNPNDSYKAASRLYQGSSGDLNKIYLLELFDLCEGLKSNVLLNIHDEFSFSLDDGELDLLHEAKHRIQQSASDWGITVPIRMDFGRPETNWMAATEAPLYTI